MKRSATLLACSVLIAGLMPLAAATAQEEAAGIRIEGVDTTRHPDVDLTVSVPVAPGDAPGVEAFRLLENGDERKFTIEPAATADLEVVLLIDTSGSMGGPPIAAAREASTALLQALPDDVRVAVVTFDDQVEVRTSFGSSREEHLAAASTLEADGNTALFDGVGTALGLFSAAEDGSGRAIVLLSDGEDTASGAVLDEVLSRLSATDVRFNAIAYGTAAAEIEGLEAMAEAAGGSVSDATEPDALVGMYEEVAATLVNRYQLSYVSQAEGSVDVAVEFSQRGGSSSDSRSTSFPVSETPAPPDLGGTTDGVPAPVEAPAPSGQASGGVLVGAALWFAALVIVALTVLWPGRVRVQLSGIARRNAGQRGLSELAARASLVAEEGLERRGYRRGLSAALERAGINLRPGEFVVLSASAAVVAFGIGLMLSGLLMGLALAVVAAAGSRVVISFRTSRRQTKFADQLGDTLQLLSGSLRAGYGLMQAVDSVAREADAPASEEFGRLVVETRLGRDMTDALEAMAERMESEDFGWVTQAMEIHREVGGDLAEVLDNVGETIRERNKIRRQVKALSAEGRMSAWVLLALPFGVALIMSIINRPYISELTTNGLLGWSLIGLGGVMMTIGMIWTMKLVKIEF